jgi:hypothetical protein
MLEIAYSFRPLPIHSVAGKDGAAKIGDAKLQPPLPEAIGHLFNAGLLTQSIKIAPLQRSVANDQLRGIREANVLDYRFNNAGMSNETLEAGATLILMEYPVGLNDDAGSSRDQRGKGVPSRCPVVFRIQAPIPKQAVESDFRRGGRPADFRSATIPSRRFVACFGSGNRDYIFLEVPHYHKYIASAAGHCSQTLTGWMNISV